MRGLAYVVAFIVAFCVAWNKLITHDGLVTYCDRHPRDRNGAMVLSYMGKWAEICSDYEKMLNIYGKIIERYPESPYAMDSQFGHALALERLNRTGEAVAEYEKFLEKYPNCPYAKSVRNNIEILKTR